MKRILLSFLLVLLSAPLFAQSKAAQIADLQNQINQIDQSFTPMMQHLTEMKTKADNIQFGIDAYDKAKKQYEADCAVHDQRQDEVTRQFALLKPSIDNYSQRVDQHNARSCTEQCTNGHCDGSCAWYTAEKNQLDANKAQLVEAFNRVNAQQIPLTTEYNDLMQTKAKLQTIYDQNQANVAAWQREMGQIKADYEAAAAKRADLERQLAALYGDVNTCIKAIPPACQSPAIGPDGKPILDQNCENMKAACSKMFDGSK
jgi:chromosome segregation ATPase